MDKIFIEQAKHIRREYIKNVREIVKCETKIESYKNDLNMVHDELNDKMDENLMRDKLLVVEKNIKSIENILNPYSIKMKQLEKDADKLFESIKERHPQMTSIDIQGELIPYLSEINF